jgi:hypothetical protein
MIGRSILNRRNSNTHVTVARRGALVATLALLLTSGAARADDWKFSVTPYAWMTNIGVDASLGGRQVIDKQIPVSDLLAVLDTIFQGRVEAKRGSFGATIDFFDVTLSDQVSGIALPQGAGRADLTSDVGMTILDVAGLYDGKGDGQGFAFLYGSRVLNQRATIDASLGLTAGPTVAQSYVTDDWLVDGLAGVRFGQRLSSHWGFQIQADASTGSTDYTWSVAPSLSYAFGKSGRYEVDAGYRRMVIDFKQDGDFAPQMTLSGALLGFKIAF